jgi:putative cell wall-binding protein
MKHLFNKQGESIMFTKLGRTAGAIVAGSAAVAMAVAMAPAASAAPAPISNNFIPSVLSASTYRIAGSDRIATAIKVAQTKTGWGTGSVALGDFVNGCDVILARSDNYPDALVSAPLAASRHAPILLNPTAALDSRVSAEIVNLHTQCGTDGNFRVTIVGGTAAISDGVAIAINDLGYPVERLQGIDRYQTAIVVGQHVLVDYSNQSLHDTNVFLATGENFPDALAAGATAAQNTGIVLLTRGTAMDTNTNTYMLQIATDVMSFGFTPTVYTVGGPAHVASPDSITYNGVDRYQTASLLADHFFQFLPSNGRTQNVGVASGENFPDAMVAGGFMANSNGPLLLTRQADLPAVTSAYLSSQRDWVNNAFVFGGDLAVSPGVFLAVNAALFN